MRLFVLLIPLLGLSFGASLPQLKELSRNPKRHSEETKSLLQKAWEIDPEMRRSRLEKLSNMAPQRFQGDSEDTIKELLAKVIPVKLSAPDDNTPKDILEINAQFGISNYLFEGDIHLTEEQLDELERELNNEGRRQKRQARKTVKKWPNSTVYFYLDDSLTDRKKEVVLAANEFIQSRTCVKFVESKTAINRIKVFNGTGCYSTVGMKGGEQMLSIGNGCDSLGTVVHEYIHALGFGHTQARSDRDTYVSVDLSDVSKEDRGNFAKLDVANSINYTPYEYGSVMHYGPSAFTNSSRNFSVIPKDTSYFYTTGHNRVSFYDIQMINEHYGCDANCPALNEPQCQNGGHPNPGDCSKCNCPSGYGGDLCDQRPFGCGETLVATEEWQNQKITFEGNKTNSADDYAICNYWITAPAGKKIEVKITKMVLNNCWYGCNTNGIEIKADGDNRIANPAYCCNEFKEQAISSSLNPTPVVAYTLFSRATLFEISFRYVDESSEPSRLLPSTKKPIVKACIDIQECPFFLTMNNCAMLEPDYAEKYCAKSCGYCDRTTTMATTTDTSTTTAEPCEDAHFCPFITANNCADLDEGTALKYCPRSCGFCSGPAKQTTTVAPGECKDASSFCAFYTPSKCDELSADLAKKMCPQTCGYCEK